MITMGNLIAKAHRNSKVRAQRKKKKMSRISADATAAVISVGCGERAREGDGREMLRDEESAALLRGAFLTATPSKLAAYRSVLPSVRSDSRTKTHSG